MPKTGAAVFHDAVVTCWDTFYPTKALTISPWGLIAFESLAAYEAYRTRLKVDREALENFAMAQSPRLILREEGNFVEAVDGTLGLAPTFIGER